MLDLANPATHAENDLTELWRDLRATDPFHWHHPLDSRPGFWVLTRHADIVAVSRDSATFGSEHGNVLATLLTGGDTAGGKMMAVTDGSRHQSLRARMAKPFSPKALTGLTRQVQQTMTGLVSSVLGRSCDFADEVAAPLPLAVIGDLLGVPPADRPYLRCLTDASLGSADPGQTVAQTWRARNEILVYFARSGRRECPLSEVFDHLSEDEVILNCYSLLLGGDQTTRLALTGAVAALAAHPVQWQRLKQGEVAIPDAVEEVLRWTTPALHSGRIALRDHGVFRAGDLITSWYASANFDETEFDEPNRFDLSRKPNRHLTFGHGPHFCIGAYLARAEIAALLSSLRQQVARIEVTGQPQRVYSNFLAGFCALPVELT